MLPVDAEKIVGEWGVLMDKNQHFGAEMDRLLSRYQASLQMGLWVGTETDCLYAYHSQQRFPAASIIKLAVYRYYLQQVQQHQFCLNQAVEIAPQQFVAGAGILTHLPERKKWQLKELLLLMLVVSDNTAANVLIDFVGLSVIQASLTSPDICLARYMMKPEQNKENQVTAAASARLLRECLALESILQITPSFLAKQQFQEGVPGLLAEADLPGLQIYNKTGRLHLIEHDVACFELHQQRIYLAGLSYDKIGTGQGIMWLREVGQIVYDYLLSDSPPVQVDAKR